MMDKNHYLGTGMEHKNRKRGLRVAIHVIAWGLMFGLPLLFITLVENAFKHGVSADERSLVDISLRIAETGVVECRVENSYFPKRDGDRSGSGIGLENLRRRLDLLYPGRHELRLEREGDTFVAVMTVNCSS